MLRRRLRTLRPVLAACPAGAGGDITFLARGLPSAIASALEGLGYEFKPAFDPSDAHGHRWVSEGAAVDLVTSEAVPDRSAAGFDVVDVVTADHAAPVIRQRMRGHDVIAIAGGTQAQRRTVNARLRIVFDEVTVISVPGPFCALVLKAAAYITDSRDRHLFDAAALLACVEDPFAERDGFTGSDAARLRRLSTALRPESGAWLALPDDARRLARDALAVLLPEA